LPRVFVRSRDLAGDRIHDLLIASLTLHATSLKYLSLIRQWSALFQ